MDQSLTRKVLALFALISIGICQQYFGGELRTKESYLYGRFEARFKSAQGDGLVSSFLPIKMRGLMEVIFGMK